MCVPDCQDKSCGPDGCGGDCGTCPQNCLCGNSGTCSPDPGATWPADFSPCGQDGTTPSSPPGLECCDTSWATAEDNLYDTCMPAKADIALSLLGHILNTFDSNLAQVCSWPPKAYTGTPPTPGLLAWVSIPLVYQSYKWKNLCGQEQGSSLEDGDIIDVVIQTGPNPGLGDSKTMEVKIAKEARPCIERLKILLEDLGEAWLDDSTCEQLGYEDPPQNLGAWWLQPSNWTPVWA